MRTGKLLLVLALCVGLTACGGLSKTLYLSGQEMEFPNGTVLGGASADQARALAELLVASHNMQMKALGNQEEHQATAEKALNIIEEVAHRQGSGEITLFFPTGSANIYRNSIEYKRLIDFVDYVSRHSTGRTVHFVLVGSASAFGPKTVNKRLSLRRAEAPIDAIDKFLVNVPHEFYKVGGVGEMYSPSKAPMKVHRRYQHVRIIAVYQTKRLPDLPATM
jgi:outer membrane protein OmpA-like peptidoglycan-associated protein